MTLPITSTTAHDFAAPVVAPTIAWVLVSRHIAVGALAALVSVVFTPITDIAEVSALSVNICSLEAASPELCGALRTLLEHPKERFRLSEVLESATAWVRVRDGGSIHPRGKRSVRAMKARVHDALEQLRVETGEVALFPGLLMAGEESDARRRAEDEARRVREDVVRLERDDLRVDVDVLDGSVDELHRQMGGTDGARDGRAD